MEIRLNKRRGITGPKVQYLRQCVKKEKPDIFVLTETRAKSVDECKSIWLSSQLQATMYTTTGRTSAGVIVYTNKKGLELITESRRESDPTGHYVIGVYRTNGLNIIIGGVYLDSSGSDPIGVAAIRSLTIDLQELMQIYDTQKIVLAGDFNVVLYANQCHSGYINKPRTSQMLHDLTAEFNLYDTGGGGDCLNMTYRRHGDSRVYSRIDYIFCTLPFNECDVSWGPMDHALLTASTLLPFLERNKLPRIRDHILGTEKFIRQGREVIIKTMLDHDLHNTYIPEQELHEMICTGIPEGFERRVLLTDREEGVTELHVLNVIISKLQKLAGRVAKEYRDKENQVIEQTDRQIKQCQKELDSTQDIDRQNALNNDITEQKILLKDRLVQKATTESLRIDTYTNTHRGRMTKCSFTEIQDKKAHKPIDKLLVDNVEITEQEQIVNVMRDKYVQCTGQSREIAPDAVERFLTEMEVELPKLSEDQAEDIGREIERDEIRNALQSAKAHSAPGPTGQTLGFYKYIFSQIPYLFTKCINIATFFDDILDSPSLTWVKRRKIIYIGKPGKDPVLPGSYRPLSLLEILYKIPAKIMTDRLGRILGDISYTDQQGFVPGRGTQYNTLSALHAIQDAENTGKSLQVLGIDINSAFDAISGECIRQCMTINGFPAHVIQAIHNLTKEGRAQIEVNGRLGEEFIQKSGVGQGDPLSAFRFNIGTEPLLRALHKHTGHCIYQDIAGTVMNPVSYADDHLHTICARTPRDVQGILDIYNRYTQVSGLIINPNKTELLTVNTPQQMTQAITDLTGISEVDTLTLLGIKITNTVQGSREATFNHIDLKATARQMRISSKKVHMLHKRLLVQTALSPMYNHAFMALGSTPEGNKKIVDSIKAGLWTQNTGAETKQVRIQVSYKRIFAAYDMGGLNIPHPQQVNEGLMLNTLERLIGKIQEFAEDEDKAPNIVRIFKGLLEYTECPDIIQAYKHGGYTVWQKIASKVNPHNHYLGSCLYAMARLHKKLEHREQTWSTAPLWGHSCNNPIMPISEQDANNLRAAGIMNIGFIYELGDGIQSNSHMPIRIQPAGIHLDIWRKVIALHVKIGREDIRRGGSVIGEYNIITIRRKARYSQFNRKLYTEELEKEIVAPPSFYTRRADRMPLPTLTEYCRSYTKIMTNSYASTAAIAFCFAVLNRTVWTAKKQALSGNAGGGQQEEIPDTGNCTICGRVEDTAHILVDCDQYSYKMWERMNMHLTPALRTLDPEQNRVDLTFSNIMYHTDIMALPKQANKQVNALLMEIKRCIYVRRTERCTNNRGGHAIVTNQRIDSHIHMACSKVLRNIQYKGKEGKYISCLMEQCIMEEVIND